MRLSLSPLAAFTILAAMLIYCGDVWMVAWNESGAAPASCSTIVARVL